MDDMDFGGLAARMAGSLDGVQACLIVSRDGLGLGVHPAAEEKRAREAWGKLQTNGDVQRGFLEVGQEVWAVARRGAYTAVMVASGEVRPGLLLDLMDTQLLAAERIRARVLEGQEIGGPAGRPEPVRRPRTPLHPEAKPEPKPEPRIEARPDPEAVNAPAAGGSEPRFLDLSKPTPVALAAPSSPAVENDPEQQESLASPSTSPEPPAQAPDAGTAPAPAARVEERHVDRIALAREFSRLLFDGGGT